MSTLETWQSTQTVWFLFLFSEGCIDAQTRKTYIVGETFIKGDKECCTCLIGGIDCAAVKSCHLGNYSL